MTQHSWLTLLYGGMVSFHQAAALVIGMDVGTTFTALLATVGGTTGARRTGLSHVIYNFITAILALLLIDLYVAAWESLAAGMLVQQGEIALVAFHTLFNILGVILILPFTGLFARLMTRVVPDRQPAWRHAENTVEDILAKREALRTRIVADTAAGQLTVLESTDRLEAVRWTVRVSHHLARITHHLERAVNAAGMDQREQQGRPSSQGGASP